MKKKRSKTKVRLYEIVDYESNIGLLSNNNKFEYKLIKNKISSEEINLYEENIINISEKPKFDIICAICLGIQRKPITCEICDNAYCTTCIDNHLKKSNKCPSCKGLFKKRINRRCNESLEHLIFKCPLECGKSINYNEVENHMITCPKNKKIYRCCLCSNDLSAANLEDSEITNHNKECPKLQFRCLWCQSTINLSESRKHQEECPKRLTDCSKCRLGYPHHLKASHDEYYCNMISSQFESYQKLFNKK